MNETNEMIPVSSEEYEAILPEGWADGDDLFDVDSWTGNAAAADEPEESSEKEADNEEAEADGEPAPAIEQADGSEESGDDGVEIPATEQTPAKAKLKFSAQIDHKMEDVELDEDDLPTIYQKAHATDRMKARLAQARPLIDRGNQLAKILGYDSIDAMLDSVEASYRQSEVDRLTSEGVHPDVAKEFVESKAQRAIASIPETVENDDSETPAARDFKAEVTDLLRAHPELRGTRLPDEVVKACVVGGRSLAGAFDEYSRKKTEAENRAVKAENKRLKQNADAARRAPVRGVSKGGVTDTKPDDPFLIGFNSDRW